MQAFFIHDDDRDRWNRFVAGSGHGHVLQSWEWGELKAATGQEPIRLALQEEGQIVAAAQVLLRPLAYGIGTIAYVPKGPVVEKTDRPVLRELVDALRELADSQHVISLKIEPEEP